jgi:hypothetical protein|tara:strand:+ start:2452 stop:3963 length:1512 start_codon:yes stop_codon:yes gene_type:complete
MTKIISWLEADLTIFCMLYFFQKKYPSDIYTIIDITNKPKSFFQSQTLVNFSKKWFYHDHINPKLEPNLNWLKNFEKKYDIDLWELGSNDRIFNHYNEYYNFSKNQILSILEQECRLFEKILDEVKPDFFITGETALQPHHLFHKLCQRRGIKILMLNHANWSTYCYISQERHRLDGLDNLSINDSDNCTFTELQKILAGSKISKYHKKYMDEFKKSKFSLLKAAFELLIKSDNSNIQTHYTYYGRTKFRVLFNELKSLIIKNQREKFINKNLLHFDSKLKPFIYLPLHIEPERSLLIAAPRFSDQIETIQEVVKNLPTGVDLYVKEHPLQGSARNWRDLSFYKKIFAIPNVKLFHPSTDSELLMKNCELVISVGGTSCFEAGFFGKPSITFADLGYSVIPSVKKLNSYDELHDAINQSLASSVDPNFIKKYIDALDQHSFDFHILDFINSYGSMFYFNGNLVDVLIDEKQMKAFLTNNEKELEELSLEFVKKINYYESITTK